MVNQHNMQVYQNCMLNWHHICTKNCLKFAILGHKKANIMQKRTFPQKMTIVDGSGHPILCVCYKEILEYDGIEHKFIIFLHLCLCTKQNYYKK